MGRPTKLDQELVLPGGARTTVRERILQLVAQGVPFIHAAAAAGIAERTYFDWMRKGRAGQAPYAQFAQDIREQHGRAVAQVVLTHRKVALGQALRSRVIKTTLSEEGAHVEVVQEDYYPPHAGALQWWMERREPAHFGQVATRDADTDPLEDGGYAGSDDPTADQQAIARILDSIAARETAGTGAAPDSQAPGGNAG